MSYGTLNWWLRGLAVTPEARIRELEDEVESHKRAALLVMLEYADRRPSEKEHLIAILQDFIPLLGLGSAQSVMAKAIIEELQNHRPFPA